MAPRQGPTFANPSDGLPLDQGSKVAMTGRWSEPVVFLRSLGLSVIEGVCAGVGGDLSCPADERPGYEPVVDQFGPPAVDAGVALVSGVSDPRSHSWQATHLAQSRRRARRGPDVPSYATSTWRDFSR